MVNSLLVTRDNLEAITKLKRSAYERCITNPKIYRLSELDLKTAPFGALDPRPDKTICGKPQPLVCIWAMVRFYTSDSGKQRQLGVDKMIQMGKQSRDDRATHF
ncbi:hypothetical protein PoB_001532500 [Plakobranchus ocellatus]|uniref:Uncharacterized protein n=1 Tax=Plakobranchus ocellatus TaxID=259542 RepID=A0AAV3Z078_9GAST|nr:hypothetical protein PoB_001532500 [Plakobranchus ocellatus]